MERGTLIKEALSDSVEGIAYEETDTIHKRKGEGSACGATSHLDDGKLRSLPIKQAIFVYGMSKCGRCFENGGGGY